MGAARATILSTWHLESQRSKDKKKREVVRGALDGVVCVCVCPCVCHCVCVCVCGRRICLAMEEKFAEHLWQAKPKNTKNHAILQFVSLRKQTFTFDTKKSGERERGKEGRKEGRQKREKGGIERRKEGNGHEGRKVRGHVEGEEG